MEVGLPSISSCEEWRQIHRRVKTLPDSRELIAAEFEAWRDLCEAISKAEERRFYSGDEPAESDLLLHREAVTLLLARGEGFRLPAIALGMKEELAALDAWSDIFRESLNLWHPTSRSEPTRRAVRALFDSE